MKTNTIILLAALTSSFAPVNVFGWGHTGHMLVAEIALSELTPTAKAKVEHFIAIKVEPQIINVPHHTPVNEFDRTSTFVPAACWADDVKNNANRDWHFVDIPFSPDGTIPVLKAVTSDVLKEIDHCTKVLKDAAASEAEKATRLRFLLHFVGDVHQPLHCATRCTNERPEGDRGGNDFLVVVPGDDNLHSYWDSGIGQFPHIDRPLDPPGQTTLDAIVTGIKTEFSKQVLAQKLTVMDPQSWADESHHLAVEVAYKTAQNKSPKASYNKRAKKICRERVALAGYRLAALLNDIYK